MAFDAFLKLDGIPGDSQDATHKGEIAVLSFRWGAKQPGGAVATGAGQHVLIPLIQDFQFTHKIDRTTPALFTNLVSGRHISEADFVVREAGGEQLEYLKIKFREVLIAQVKPYGRAEQHEGFGESGLAAITDRLRPGEVHTYGDEVPYEEVSFNFARVEISFQPQGPDGKAEGPPVTAGWDIKENKIP